MTSYNSVPTAVEHYFDLMDGNDATQVLDVFATGARVTDDGHTYTGRDEILAWLTGAATEFTTTSTRLSVANSDADTVVAVRLEGNFPGGTVDLRHVFTVDDTGLIRGLVIAA
jgi:hypothetical protein